MTYRAIDCQGFAGGFTLGMVQAGFTLVGKREEKGGFGVANCEANRHLLGYDWKAQASDPAAWEVVDAEVLFGNPPCSGFSLLSRKDFRGSSSSINSCMWNFVGFGIRTMPYIMVFESVQQAFTGGRDLMQALRAWLEQATGQRWTLHHVLHNAASLGGSSIRRRYFWVASRIPFGVEPCEVTRVPMLDDVIGDLRDLGMTWERQPYRRTPSWWAASRRSPSEAVDGHVNRDTPAAKRAYDLLGGTTWGEKEIISKVAKRYYETHGRLPESWPEHVQKKLVETDFAMGYNQLVRWRGDRMCRVITGGGLDLVLHPHEDRLLTHREVARIMGFPDDWLVKPLKGTSALHLTWGKGIIVDCGKWIGGHVMNALLGQPGSQQGELIGDREFLINETEAYRAVSAER